VSMRCACGVPIADTGSCPVCGTEGPRYRQELEAREASRRGKPQGPRQIRNAPDGEAPHPADEAKATPGRQRGKVPSAAPQAPFPVPDEAMFYGLAGEIVNSVDPFTEASRPAVLVHLLAGCGAMMGRGPHMMAGFAKHPPSVWGLIVGGTSLGAKGTAEATASAFLRAAWPEFMDSRVLPGLSSGEGLVHQVRDPVEDTDEGEKDKRLYVVLSEFRTVMAQARRETNTLAATLRLAWDSPAVLHIPNRGNNALKATGAHIVMVAHVTPGEFRARIDPGEIAGGSLNRFLIIASRTSKNLPDEPLYPVHQLDAYGTRVRNAVETAYMLGNRRIGRTENAQKLWKENYPSLKNPVGAQSEDDEGILAAVVVRARPHVLRTALTYALLDERQIVGEEHLAAALALWRYSLDSARWLFRTASPDLVKLRAFIDEAGPAGRSKEEIRSDLFGRHLKADEIDRLLSQLGSDYEEYAVPTKGRPRTVYRHRPSAERAKGAESL